MPKQHVKQILLAKTTNISKIKSITHTFYAAKIISEQIHFSIHNMLYSCKHNNNRTWTADPLGGDYLSLKQSNTGKITLQLKKKKVPGKFPQLSSVY